MKLSTKNEYFYSEQFQESANISRATQSEFGRAVSLPRLGGDVFKELCRFISFAAFLHRASAHFLL